MEQSFCHELKSSSTSDMALCLTCAVYMALTAVGSFLTGALVNACARAIQQRALLSKTIIDIKDPPQLTSNPLPSKPLGPPPKRRHSISVASSSERSGIAVLAARRNKAFRGSPATADAAQSTEKPNQEITRSLSSDKVKDDEERDTVGPLASSSGQPKGFMAIRQKGRSFAASLRKMALLHDNAIEQVMKAYFRTDN